jgi:hypothetical protein
MDPGWAQFPVNVEAAYKFISSNSNMRSSLKGTKLQTQFNICCIRIIWILDLILLPCAKYFIMLYISLYYN